VVTGGSMQNGGHGGLLTGEGRGFLRPPRVGGQAGAAASTGPGSTLEAGGCHGVGGHPHRAARQQAGREATRARGSKDAALPAGGWLARTQGAWFSQH